MQTGLQVVLSLVLISTAYAAPFFHLRRWKRLSAEEAFALSLAAASLLFGAAAFATHAADLPQRPLHAAVFLLLIVSVIPQLMQKGSVAEFFSARAASWMLLFLSLILLLQIAFPVYIGGFWYFDWWQHYNLSQMYMGKVPHDYLWLGMYNFASRTPLMNLNAAFFLSLFGDAYWRYQIVASILNSAVILPAYLLMRRISGGKTAIIVIALLFLSPSIVHNTFYPWQKLFAAYFVLLAAYFYFRFLRDDSLPENAACLLVFALICAGFLAHQSSLFSSIVILLDMGWRALRRNPARLLRLGVACALCFLVIDGIWFGWAISYFGLKRSFLSYYERPATVGGLSGYLVVFTYHTVATLCSPLFAYDLVGKFGLLRFYENIQVLYYNSLIGMATLTAAITAVFVLARNVIKEKASALYPRFAGSLTIKNVLTACSLWCLLMALLVLFIPSFGSALLSHFFNHPAFARKMFGWFFFTGALAFGTVAIASWWAQSRQRKNDFSLPLLNSNPAAILFWMTFLGYAGGILTHHEIYIHGMVSAGSATAVFLTVLFIGRVISDIPRPARILLAVPILVENFLITWLPLLIMKNKWGWAEENNWYLKQQKALVFLADLFPSGWHWAMAAGIALQAAMLLVWILTQKKESDEQRDRAESAFAGKA
jgi:hypothetical protein